MNNMNSIILSLAVILASATGVGAQENASKNDAPPPVPAETQKPEAQSSSPSRTPESASVPPENEPDNTARNRSSEPNAQNQSNQKASIDRVAKLRRVIVGKKGLSSDAKNVKIIDENGIVTLRGPVDNLHEKQTVERLARQYAGAKIKSELEVRSPR